MSKPTPTVHSVNISFYVGKCNYKCNVSTNECVRIGNGPMNNYYPLDETSLNDRMAKEFVKNLKEFNL